MARNRTKTAQIEWLSNERNLQCFVAGQSNENISLNLIIGNEKKSNCDNGLVPIQPQ